MNFERLAQVLATTAILAIVGGSVLAGKPERPRQCRAAQVKQGFSSSKSIKMLLLPLSGIEDVEAELGVRISQEMKAEAPGFLAHMERELAHGLPAASLTIQTLDCTVQTPNEAAAVGRAAGASMVAWGRATCLLSDRPACRNLLLRSRSAASSPAPPSSRVVLILTQVKDEAVLPVGQLRELDPFRSVEFPSQPIEHAHVLLAELISLYAVLDHQHDLAERLLLSAQPTAAEDIAGRAAMDVLIGMVELAAGRGAAAQARLEHVLSECVSDRDPCRVSSLQGLGRIYAEQGKTDRAIESLTQALGLSEQMKDSKQRSDILTELGLMQARSRHYSAALPLLEHALELHRASQGLPDQAQALTDIGQLHYLRGQLSAARRSWEQATALYQQLDDPLGLLSVLIRLGAIVTGQGEFQRAEELLNRALVLAQEARSLAAESMARSMLGALYYQKKELVQAIYAYREALRIGKAASDAASQSMAEFGLGATFSDLEDHEQAVEHLTAAQRFLKPVDDPAQQAMVHLALGRAYMALKRPAQAVTAYELGLKEYQRSGDENGQADALGLLGSAYLVQDRWIEAQPRLEAALRILENEKGKDPAQDGKRWILLGALGELHIHRDRPGDLDAAIRCFEKALALPASVGQPADRHHLMGLLATTLGDVGRTSEAIARYRQMAALHDEQGDAPMATLLRINGLNLALDAKKLSLAEQLFAGLRQHGLSPLNDAAVEARLLWYRGSPDAMAAYQRLAEGAEQAGNEFDRTLFSGIAAAGLWRSQHPQEFRGCAGALVFELGDKSTPLQPGDVLWDLEGQCPTSAQWFDRALRREPLGSLRRFNLKVWRRGQLMSFSILRSQLPVKVIGF